MRERERERVKKMELGSEQRKGQEKNFEVFMFIFIFNETIQKAKSRN